MRVSCRGGCRRVVAPRRVDGRDKPGHDDMRSAATLKNPAFRSYFPTHNRANISPSTSSTPIRPTMRSMAEAARRRSSAINSGSAASGCERRGQRLARVLKTAPVPFQRQQSRLARRHALFGQFRNSVKQPVNPSACFGRYGKVCRPCRQRVSLLEVDLGPHRQDGRFQARRRLAVSAVVQPQHQVRALGSAARSRDAFLFDRILGCRGCPPCRRE